MHDAADVFAQHIVGDLDYGRGVPHGDVLLEVVHHRGDEHRSHELARAEYGRHEVRQVRLEVREVVLIRECRDRAAQ